MMKATIKVKNKTFTIDFQNERDLVAKMLTLATRFNTERSTAVYEGCRMNLVSFAVCGVTHVSTWVLHDDGSSQVAHYDFIHSYL